MDRYYRVDSKQVQETVKRYPKERVKRAIREKEIAEEIKRIAMINYFKINGWADYNLE